MYISREILAITHINISETVEYGRGVIFELIIPKEYSRFESTGVGSP